MIKNKSETQWMNIRGKYQAWSVTAPSPANISRGLLARQRHPVSAEKNCSTRLASSPPPIVTKMITMWNRRPELVFIWIKALKKLEEWIHRAAPCHLNWRGLPVGHERLQPYSQRWSGSKRLLVSIESHAKSRLSGWQNTCWRQRTTSWKRSC